MAEARSPWRRLWVALGLLAGGGALSSLGLVKYSESPRFCSSCHIMEPYYQAWKTSRHNQVSCVECHYPPGAPQTLAWKKFQAVSQVVKYVTRTYSSKPFAEVEDASCLRSGCHSARLLEGLVFSPEKRIKFDHRPHLTETRRGRRLRCTSCHSQIVVGRHVEVTYDTCYLCHFKGRGLGKELKALGGCLSCHDLPSGEFRIGSMTYDHRDFVSKRGVSCQNCHLDVVRGEGLAREDRCLACHNQPEKLARFSDIPFLHENHVTRHNVACFHCHDEIRHGFGESDGRRLARLGEPPLPPDRAVGRRHPPTLSFDCGQCHEDKHHGTLQMYAGKVPELGLADMPSPMHQAEVDCVGCHYKEHAGGGGVNGRTFAASEQACVKCHGPKFQGFWEATRAGLAETLKGLEGKEGALRLAVAASTAPAASPARALLARAERCRRFVKGARGEHNVYLASAILRRADKALTEGGEAVSASLPDISGDPLLSGTFCATLCHDKLGVKVPAETVRFAGKDMPHKAHADLMGCVACHEIGGHKKAPLKKGFREACSQCHPE